MNASLALNCSLSDCNFRGLCNATSGEIICSCYRVLNWEGERCDIPGIFHTIAMFSSIYSALLLAYVFYESFLAFIVHFSQKKPLNLQIVAMTGAVLSLIGFIFVLFCYGTVVFCFESQPQKGYCLFIQTKDTHY